jgi:hypothetical protein
MDACPSVGSAARQTAVWWCQANQPMHVLARVSDDYPEPVTHHLTKYPAGVS